MTLLEEYASFYSDMHKDAFGFRPRADVSHWTEDHYKAEFAFLEEVIDRKERDRLDIEKIASQEFEGWVADLLENGATDRENAIAALMEDRDLNIKNLFDREHYEFLNSLPFGYITNSLQ